MCSISTLALNPATRPPQPTRVGAAPQIFITFSDVPRTAWHVFESCVDASKSLYQRPYIIIRFMVFPQPARRALGTFHLSALRALPESQSAYTSLHQRPTLNSFFGVPVTDAAAQRANPPAPRINARRPRAQIHSRLPERPRGAITKPALVAPSTRRAVAPSNILNPDLAFPRARTRQNHYINAPTLLFDLWCSRDRPDSYSCAYIHVAPSTPPDFKLFFWSSRDRRRRALRAINAPAPRINARRPRAQIRFSAFPRAPSGAITEPALVAPSTRRTVAPSNILNPDLAFPRARLPFTLPPPLSRHHHAARHQRGARHLFFGFRVPASKLASVLPSRQHFNSRFGIPATAINAPPPS
ncbi:hypothetical protein DFH09DRAFT_1415944 [Mycena vulgaris]|nr:hypothetical protein DFH09DRAFT_1415944 [Mycena vulgaris]